MAGKLMLVETTVKDFPWLLRRDGDNILNAKVGANKFEIIVEAKNLKESLAEKVEIQWRQE